MPPKTKPGNGSKLAVSHRTRSHTRTDITESTSIDVDGVSVSAVVKPKIKARRDEVEGKRKVDAMFDEIDAPDATTGASCSKMGVKRAKKADQKPKTYMNPFIPQPSLTVAEHEAHSRVLSETDRLPTPSDLSTNCQSLFSKSLASIPNKEILPSPPKALAAAPKSRSQTPARPLLILAPLPPAKPKTVARNAPIPTPAHRPFLAPSSARASPAPTSTRFSTPFSLSSTQAPSALPAWPQSPLLTKSAASHRTSKVVTDKISVLETRVGRLEDEVKNIQGSLVDMKKGQWKSAEENDELIKLRAEFGELKEESEAQAKLLHLIERILEGLKADGISVDKAVTKIETSTRSNAFNVSDTSYFVV
jgi:hypothetical protein